MTFSIAIRTVPERAQLFGSLMARLEQEETVAVSASLREDVTPNENGCLALEMAECQDTDWVIFLEDDAGLIDDFMGSVERWIEDHATDDIHVYPLGAQYKFPEGATAWVYPLDHYYCSVAFVIRRSMIPSLVEYFRARPAVNQGFDLMIAEWHRTVSPSNHLLTPVPCFVEHLGDESTLIDGRSERNVVGRFFEFRGYDFTYQRTNWLRI